MKRGEIPPEGLRKYYKLKIAKAVKHGWKTTEIRPCGNCGRKLRIQAYWLKGKLYRNFYCDKKCESKARSYGKNLELKGGWQDKRYGYYVVRVSGKATYRHRVIMERKIGRKLRSGEQVHHLNGVPGDDRLDNLMVVNYRNHPSEKDRKIRILQSRIRELENVHTKKRK